MNWPPEPETGTAAASASGKAQHRGNPLDRLEWLVAIGITLLAVSLHLIVLLSGGGLWRDEANTVQLAALPSIGEIWSHLQYDSFPMLWILILRGWSMIGPASDFSFRLLGFLVGMGILGGLWFQARQMCSSPPLFSLVLAGMNSALIVWGGTMRAYGLGALLILFAFTLIWKATLQPDRWNIFLATLCAVAGVQTLYQDAPLLLALGVASAIWAWRSGNWKRAVWPLSIGFAAGVSLLPYLGTMKKVADVNLPLKISHFSLATFWEKISEATGDTSLIMTWVWVALAAWAVFGGCVCQLYSDRFRAGQDQKNLALYSVLAVVLGVGGYYGFLWFLSYPTKLWYYIALLPLTAAAMEPLVGLWCNHRRGRVARLIIVLFLAVALYWPAMKAVQSRRTNVDQVANYLNQHVVSRDFVIVSPWFFEVSFQRYYRGTAEWLALPPIGPQTLHRYDLLREKMMMPRQEEVVRPLLEKIQAALQSGQSVWLAGALEFGDPNQTLPTLPPAPQSVYRWNDNPYTQLWSMQAARFLQLHAVQAEQVRWPDDLPVNGYEYLSLIHFSGWR